MNTSKTTFDLLPEESKLIEPNEYYTWRNTAYDSDDVLDTVIDVICYRRRKLSNGMVRLYLRYPTRSITELDLIAMNNRIHNEQHT